MWCSLASSFLGSGSMLSDSLRSDDLLLPMLDKLESEEFREFIETSDKLKFIKHETLISEGDLVDDLFVIKKGSCSLLRSGAVVDSIKRGHCVGHTSFIYRKPYFYTVVANENSTVYRLSRRHYDKIVLSVERYFKTIPLFERLTSNERQRLHGHSRIVVFGKKEKVVMKGEAANQFYVVLEGWASAINGLLICFV